MIQLTPCRPILCILKCVSRSWPHNSTSIHHLHNIHEANDANRPCSIFIIHLHLCCFLSTTIAQLFPNGNDASTSAHLFPHPRHHCSLLMVCLVSNNINNANKYSSFLHSTSTEASLILVYRLVYSTKLSFRFSTNHQYQRVLVIPVPLVQVH